MQMINVKNCFGLLVALFLVLAFGVNSGAQQEEYQQDMLQQQDPALEVSEEQLDRVADAYLDVMEIRDDFHKSLSEVTEPEEAQQLQEQAGEAMVEAVHSHGLEVQTYNQVMEAAQVDEDLRNALLERLENRQ